MNISSTSPTVPAAPDVPAFTPVRVDQASLGSRVLGMVDPTGILHAFTPERSRTLTARDLGEDGWWWLTFDDGYECESLGLGLLAVTGQAPA